MNGCAHRNLILLPQKSERLRCRRCHLTIKADELEDDYCPECYEASGLRIRDFETLAAPEEPGKRYRCEDCGATIETSENRSPKG